MILNQIAQSTDLDEDRIKELVACSGSGGELYDRISSLFDSNKENRDKNRTIEMPVTQEGSPLELVNEMGSQGGMLEMDTNGMDPNGMDPNGMGQNGMGMSDIDPEIMAKVMEEMQ